MPDTMTPQQRHKCMSRIRGRDTKPELIVRRRLWAEGWRYRLCVKGFPGRPDIVLRRLKTVIFVNGCFWHGHNVQAIGTEEGACGVVEIKGTAFNVQELENSECCKIPHTNREFWLAKITRNRIRDYQNYAAYHQAGWRVLVVWECMLKPKTREVTLRALSQRLNSIFLESVRKKPKPYAIPEEGGYLIAAEPAERYGINKSERSTAKNTSTIAGFAQTNCNSSTGRKPTRD